MTAYMTSIPAETDVLCEGCGYTLNGLPGGAKCPECGKPTAESSPALRRPATWERHGTRFGGIFQFIRTTLEVLFRPTAFYRTLATRESRKRSRQFALVHWTVVSFLFALAAYFHLKWFLETNALPLGAEKLDKPVAAVFCLTVITCLFLLGITRLAATLTTWEAGYRGLRLPLPVVLRGLDYHAAHYLPVGIVAAGTVVGYHLLRYRHLVSSLSETRYLYILCAEVVVAAVYLFWTYWIGMRNMMYANA